jgi:hypothetical protein
MTGRKVPAPVIIKKAQEEDSSVEVVSNPEKERRHNGTCTEWHKHAHDDCIYNGNPFIIAHFEFREDGAAKRLLNVF